MSGFAILLGLFLKALELSAEFNFASNGAIFSRDHRTKSATCAQNTGFSIGFSRYFLSGFAILLGLFLKPLGIGEELNSALKPIDFRDNPISIVNTDGPNHAKYYYVDH